MAVYRNPFVTVIVTGVPGVGKTTVLGKIRELLEAEDIPYLAVNFGDYMFSEASRAGWVEHRDQMRHLPLLRQLELQGMAARAIRLDAEKKLGDKGVLLVDTHAVIKTATGYWPGLPEAVVKELRPDSIVLLEAPPEVIYERQRRDTARKRSDIGGVEAIRQLLEIARTAAMASAVLVSASIYPVENVEGKPEVAAQEIVSLIKRLR